VRSIVAELLDSVAGWDGKIPTTLWLLVRHPGRLTTEFLAGRRARYLRPLRLYLTLSLVYFLALAAGRDAETGNLKLSMQEPAADSVAPRNPRRPARVETPPDTTTLSGRLEQGFEARVRRYKAMPEAERNRAFTRVFFGQLPNMVFALVPVVALLLRVAYRRTPLYYAEHLVHALHLHAFAMVALLAVHVTPGAWAVLPFLALPAYVWVALRRVYGGSAVRTTVKLTLIFGAYAVALVLAISAFALITLLFFLG
jgi:hypothetical protein